MPTETISTTTPPRRHPVLAAVFKNAESRHFKDEELDLILREYPDKAMEIAAAKEIREKDVAIVNRVVKEIFSQYDYEKLHDFSSPKCTRDVRYVVAYSCMAMISGEPQWIEDKLLIWLKTILQAFDFPERTRPMSGVLFADQELEKALEKQPKKVKSIYHTYYRLRQEMAKELQPEHYELIEPYLTLSLDVLCEEY